MLSTAAGKKVWSNIMEILDEKDGVDTELLVYAMTLINKVRWHSHPKKLRGTSAPVCSSFCLMLIQ